ncbi:hypothetical protein EV644_1301, partial [Kribbella orskensis]
MEPGGFVGYLDGVSGSSARGWFPGAGSGASAAYVEVVASPGCVMVLVGPVCVKSASRPFGIEQAR